MQLGSEDLGVNKLGVSCPLRINLRLREPLLDVVVAVLARSFLSGAILSELVSHLELALCVKHVTGIRSHWHREEFVLLA